MTPSHQFIVSTEQECLTSVLAGDTAATLSQFFETLKVLAPSTSASAGLFNGYGRIYLDSGHVEMAACECDSPYTLALIIERQQRLVARAVNLLAERGQRLLITNNNHSGVLMFGCPTWGAHENYLTQVHPGHFGELILPFLVTRIYGGAGGIEAPLGNFVAGVRSLAMEQPTGGSTTESRAIHSTSREEHHMGERRGQYRYHLILGDAHRSQFNTALQFGATALAIKAAQYDRQLQDELRDLGWAASESWVTTLRQLNLLQSPASPLAVHPRIVATQTVYLEAARRFTKRIGKLCPEWALQLLDDWEQTLAALARLDRDWLAPRLDAFAKYEFYSAVLTEKGKTWADLGRTPGLLHELALLDHSYHEFCNPDSVFARLEQAGLLEHRVGELIEPGDEEEPFVPEVKTRARARARFIRQHAASGSCAVDWAWANDNLRGQFWQLEDPFAEDFSPHQRSPALPSRHSHEQVEMLLREAQQFYDVGQYPRAQQYLDHLAPLGPTAAQERRRARLLAWTRARLGYVDGHAPLEQLYGAATTDLNAVADFCCVFRFRGLVPHPSIEQWLDRGRSLLAACSHLPHDPPGAIALRDHAAAALRAEGNYVAALDQLKLACDTNRHPPEGPRVQGRIFAALGDVQRVLGNLREARRVLAQARAMQESASVRGDLAEFTLTALARLEPQPADALAHLAEAKTILVACGHIVGQARALLLEARIAQDTTTANDIYPQVTRLRRSNAGLGQCQRLGLVLDNWHAWTTQPAARQAIAGDDRFWGV